MKHYQRLEMENKVNLSKIRMIPPIFKCLYDSLPPVTAQLQRICHIKVLNRSKK